MNKKILSGIIILITIISVSIMLFYNKGMGKENKEYDEGKVEVRKDLNIQRDRDLNGQKNVEIEKFSDNKSIVKNKDEEKKKDEQKKREDVKEEKNEVEKSVHNKNDNIIEDESILVFKVSKDNIPNQLTLFEKAKILSILRKLSSIDYAKINESLNKSNELEGAKEALKLLKLRLNSKDYKEIKGILSRFIENIDILENSIWQSLNKS